MVSEGYQFSFLLDRTKKGSYLTQGGSYLFALGKEETKLGSYLFSFGNEGIELWSLLDARVLEALAGAERANLHAPTSTLT